MGEQTCDTLKSEIERHIGDVKAALKSDDVERVTSTSEALKKALQGVGAAIYGQSSAAGNGSNGSGHNGGGFGGHGGTGGKAGAPGHDENTVEGEYQEV